MQAACLESMVSVRWWSGPWWTDVSEVGDLDLAIARVEGTKLGWIIEEGMGAMYQHSL